MSEEWLPSQYNTIYFSNQIIEIYIRSINLRFLNSCSANKKIYCHKPNGTSNGRFFKVGVKAIRNNNNNYLLNTSGCSEGSHIRIKPLRNR